MKKSNLFLIALLLIAAPTWAKKDKSGPGVPTASQQVTVNPRLQNMSAEDAQLFNALTKDQQKNISAGRVEEGYNEWMAKKALGDPYYATEHSPIFVDYEQVWLYTKAQSNTTNTEEKIMDVETNWPTIHKTNHTKTCTIGDFFLLFDRGVIQKIVPDTSGKIYGTCVITTSEEFLPIVTTPVETKKKK